MNSYETIYAVVRRIPAGRVSSYGRVARLAGRPGAARLVGYALHALREQQSDEVPWWRVVNHQGFISNAYEAEHQAARLVAEGVVVADNHRIDLRHYLWEGEA
ncbi:MAG: MGMT family protein [Oscillochloridaceae bacterium umkhey_bin13]